MLSVARVLLEHSVLFGVLHEGERTEALQAHQQYPHELLETTRLLRQLLEISAFVGVIVTGMLSWHMYLCLTAQTSVEYRYAALAIIP
eukprot:COSAG03_NODE_552_length_6970_cov_232.041140_2_plen_88_part_00